VKITAPIRISRQGNASIKIAWNDGTVDTFPVRNLRLSCPCAACVNEWTGEKILNDGQVDPSVRPIKIYSVGRYAMGIHWTDGHKTGIFAYDYLKKLAMR
jgi:DUF971 family protein